MNQNCEVCANIINENLESFISRRDCHRFFHASCANVLQQYIEYYNSSGLPYRCDKCRKNRRLSIQLPASSNLNNNNTNDRRPSTFTALAESKSNNNSQQAPLITFANTSSSSQCVDESEEFSLRTVCQKLCKLEQLMNNTLQTIGALLGENVELKTRVHSLESKLNWQHQKSLKNSIEITGVPNVNDANAKGLAQALFLKALSIEVPDNKIEKCYVKKVHAKRNGKNNVSSSSSKASVICLSFSDMMLKEKIMKEKTKKKSILNSNILDVNGGSGVGGSCVGGSGVGGGRISGGSDGGRGNQTSPFVESDKTEIDIKDVDPDCLKILIDYLYTGLLKFHSVNIERVLLSASFLQITSAEEACCSFLVNNLVLENCIEYIIFAGKHSIRTLSHKAIQMAVINFHQIFSKDEYLEIDFDDFKILVQGLKDSGCIEDSIYAFVMRWVNHSYELRVDFLQDLLDYLQPALISPDILASPRISPRANHFLDHWAAPATSANTNEAHVQILITRRIGDFVPRTIKFFTENEQRPIDMLSEKIFDGSYICHGYNIYHMGGWKNEKKIIGESYAFHQINSDWVNFVPLLQARAYHRSGVLNGSIYTLGGSDGLKALSHVENLDLHTGYRSCCEELPRAKEQMGLAIYGNSIYTIGGKNRGSNLKCIHRLDPRIGKWEEIVTKTYRLGTSSCAVVYNDIYTTHSDALQRYDVRANLWTLVRTQYDRYPDQVFALDNKLYGLFKDHIGLYVPEEGRWSMQRQLKYHHDYLSVSTNLLYLQAAAQEFNIIMDDMNENIDNDMFEEVEPF